MPVANTVFPNICCTGCVADVKIFHHRGPKCGHVIHRWKLLDDEMLQMEMALHLKPQRHVKAATLVHPHQTAMQACELTQRGLKRLWVFVLLDPPQHRTAVDARGVDVRHGLARSWDGDLGQVASFLPHCAFQSVKDLCPQYLANALSVDWLLNQTKKPLQRRHAHPKARVERVEFPLEHLAVAA